jgi:hypothetical protein
VTGAQARSVHALPRRFLLSVSAGSAGDGLARAGLPLLAASMSASVGTAGFVQAAARLSWLVVALPAGLLIDRAGARPVLVSGTLLKLVGLGCLLGAAVSGLLWAVAAAAFVAATGEVLVETAAQAGIACLVEADRLARANAQVYGRQVTLGQLGAPAAGGAVYELNRLAPFGCSLLLQAAAVFGFFRGSAPDRRSDGSTAGAGLASALVAGFRPLFTSMALLATTLIGATSMLAYGVWTAVFVYFVTRAEGLGLPAGYFGLLLAATAVGAAVGSRIAPWYLARTDGFACVLAMVAGQVGLFVPPLLGAGAVVVAGGLVVYGLGLGAWNVGVVAFRQSSVPPALLGRVTASYRFLSWGATPVGAFAGGTLAASAGLRVAFGVGLVLVVVQGLLAVLALGMRNYKGA